VLRKSGIPKPKLKLKLKASDYWRTWISDLVEVWLNIPVLMQTLVVNDAALSPSPSVEARRQGQGSGSRTA
jgi:hypothetical protein